MKKEAKRSIQVSIVSVLLLLLIEVGLVYAGSKEKRCTLAG